MGASGSRTEQVNADNLDEEDQGISQERRGRLQFHEVLRMIGWIFFVSFVAIPLFFLSEVLVRPFVIPYLIYLTNGGDLRDRPMLVFILSLVPGYPLFAISYLLWGFPQIIINLIPYYKVNCRILVEKRFPINIYPIIWPNNSKHVLYDFYLLKIGMFTFDKKITFPV